MALFNTVVLQTLRERMFIDGYYTESFQNYSNPTSFTSFVTLHSGSQPTANDVRDNWSTYNYDNSSFLAGGLVGIQETSTSSFTIVSTTSTTANRSGTATWAILWSSRLTSTATSLATLTTSSFTGATPPTNIFTVVPVSDITTTTGVIRINDQNVVAGQVSTISEVTFTIGQI
jgi:hypothetical protein